MKARDYLFLALLGLLVAVGVAAFQPAPGYIDADYYYAGGLQLATGHGFTEPYLWNYLDNPAGLPHPSHAYWMPLASILVAAGAALFGPGSWLAARIGTLLVVALIPPLTAALAWSFTSRRDLSISSGLLAVFSAFYLPFLTTTDTFGLYMLLGGLFFLVLVSKFPPFLRALFIGLLAGLMHLSRADGLLWLLMGFVAVLVTFPKQPRRPVLGTVYYLFLAFAGYLLVMGPWFLRNLHAFGTPLAPGGSKMLWLTNYDQLFSYPASGVTFSAWVQSGIWSILRVRLWALGLNLANALAVQGEIFLLPLIALAAWFLRRDRRIWLAVSAWALTLAAMTVVFPFAGARGGFYHSGAAVQTVWWALAPLGLDRIVEWGRRSRNWDAQQALAIFRPTLVGLAVLLTAVIVYGRVVGGQAWGQESVAYRQVEQFLATEKIPSNAVVVVANPPGFYLASGLESIAMPDGDADTILALGRKYGADVLILEKGSIPGGLMPVYDQPQGWTGLEYLGGVGEARIFVIKP